VQLHPTLHKPLHPSLSSIAMRFLNGSSAPILNPLLEPASRLYSSLHVTGGKVGASTLWRKAVDETVALAWSAFFASRTTFHTEGCVNYFWVTVMIVDRSTQVSPTPPLTQRIRRRIP
jgi:hypothetical protein